MMKPARMKNGSARKMNPPDPRCALVTTAIMSPDPIACTQVMPIVARTKPTGTPIATIAKKSTASVT